MNINNTRTDHRWQCHRYTILSVIVMLIIRVNPTVYQTTKLQGLYGGQNIGRIWLTWKRFTNLFPMYRRHKTTNCSATAYCIIRENHITRKKSFLSLELRIKNSLTLLNTSTFVTHISLKHFIQQTTLGSVQVSYKQVFPNSAPPPK